jgi:ABC transporter, substrate-binding protein
LQINCNLDYIILRGDVMKKVLLTILSVIVLLVLFIVCAYTMKWTKITNITDGIKDQIIGKKEEKKKETSEEKIKVATTIKAVESLVKAVGKDKVKIEKIVPDGTEIHEFEPKAQDILKLSNAKMFVYNGDELETWADKAVESVKNKNLKVVELAKDIEKLDVKENDILDNDKDKKDEKHDEKDHDHEHKDGEKHDDKGEKKEGHHHHHDGKDPHTWLSLKNAKKYVEKIKESLIEVDSKNKEFYEKNAKQVTEEIDKLYNEYSGKFAKSNKKNFVIGHPAFAYLANEFGLKQLSVEDVFGEGTPTIAKMKALVEYCKKNNVKGILVESTANKDVINTVSRETGAKIHQVYVMEDPAESLEYIEAMKKNLELVYGNLN